MRTSLNSVAIALVTVVLAGQPGAVRAQQLTCGAFVSIAYVAGPSPAGPGDTIRVRIRFSAGDISGGTAFTVNRVRFDLDCNNPPVPGAVGCLDDGLVIAYGGDGAITTTCEVAGQNVTWSTGHAADGFVNQVVFTPSDPIVIPANVVNHCELQFDVNVLALSDDNTPNRAEEVAGYDSTQGDGQCDNGLASSVSQSAAIPLTATSSSSTTNTTATSTTSTTLTAVDADGDGVLDSDEPCICLETTPGTAVTILGCSVDQLCPCTAPVGRSAWANHGEYVGCVETAAQELADAGSITQTDRIAGMRAAGQSDCGR